MSTRRYTLRYPVDVIVEIEAETLDDALAYARSSVIDELCSELLGREIYISDPDIKRITVMER